MTRNNDRLDMLVGDLKSRYGEYDDVVLAVRDAMTDERPHPMLHHFWPSQTKHQIRSLRSTRLTSLSPD